VKTALLGMRLGHRRQPSHLWAWVALLRCCASLAKRSLPVVVPLLSLLRVCFVGRCPSLSPLQKIVGSWCWRPVFPDPWPRCLAQVAYSQSRSLWLALEVCLRHLRRHPSDKWSVWNKLADTAHCDWKTYRLLAWSLVLVLVPQLHRIAHVGHADAERRRLGFPYVSASVTALGTTAGPDTLPAIGDTRCLVTLLGGGVVRQGRQRKIGRAQARYIAESGRRRGRGGGGLQASSVDLGMWLWWCWSSCRCRDLGVSCHGSGKAHASERDRGWPECGSRCGGKKVTMVHTLTAQHACYGGR
jgi:hypothetical protein